MSRKKGPGRSHRQGSGKDWARSRGLVGFPGAKLMRKAAQGKIGLRG